MTPTEDQYRGALVGLALGDALGARHEGGPIARLLWRVIGSTPDGRFRFTDDTQMSLDLALSLLRCGCVDQDDLAASFARSYRWDRGYGRGAAQLLKRVRAGRAWREASRSVYPAGSFGNGAAMRAPVVGLFYQARPDELPSAARQAAEVTHAHPLGIEGALLIADATAAALERSEGTALLARAARLATSAEYSTRLARARTWLAAQSAVPPRVVRAQLGLGLTAPLSCVTALYLAARFLTEPFESLLAFTAQAGGDVDTVGAMAGALWGAHHGFARLPAALVARLEDAERIGAIAGALHARVRGGA